MNTDKELLEFATKAAGLRIVNNSAPVSLYIQSDGCCGGVRWNPLTDDGDALRLAVALWLIPNLQEIIERFIPEEDFDSDREAATRRAIVRAAAEIGRAMP